MIQKLTKEQAIVITGYIQVPVCFTGDFIPDVERRLGRSLSKSEMMNTKVREEIKAAYRDDFIAMTEYDPKGI